MSEEEIIIEEPLLSIMSLWVSPTNFTSLMLRLLEELVWKLIKQYFKLLKNPSYKIRRPLLEQTERRL